MKIFAENLQNLIGRRFDPEFHDAISSTNRTYRFPTQKLRSLAYFQTGGTPSTSEPEYWGGAIPWISAKDFRQFRFKDSEDHITELAVEEATTKFIDSDAMLMVCRSGILQHTLPVMICQRPAAINQDIKAFFPDDRLTVEFLATFFEVHGSQLLPLICKSGATVQSVNTEELMALDIPLPPPDVQRKIVAELDEAYAAKRAADQKAAELLRSIDDMVLEELGIPRPLPQKGLLQERLFTVSTSKLWGERIDAIAYQFARSEFYRCVNKGTYEIFRLHSLVEVCRNQTDEISTQRYVGLENINPEDGEYIETETKESCSSAVIFHQGQILFPKLRPYLNKVWLANFDGVASTEFISIEVGCNVNKEYLLLYLRLGYVASTMGILMTGNTLPRVQLKDVLSLPIPVPPTSVQDRIVRKAKAMKAEARKLKAEAAAKLESAKRRIEEELMEV